MGGREGDHVRRIRFGRATPKGDLCPPLGDDFVVALEETSRKIDDPVAKLRYLRGSIAQYEENRAGRPEKPRRPTPVLVSLAALAVCGFSGAAWYFSRPAVADSKTAPVARAAVAEDLPEIGRAHV